MDISEKDPNKSDEDLSEQIPDELPIEDSASNMEEDDGINEANLEFLRLSLTEDRTPTDPGTGEALFSEPPPIPRIKELRREILTSPPVRRRSSRKLDFPPGVSTPKNSPENKSPEVTSGNPYTFGKELYESMPGSSAEVVKRRLSLTNPVNPFLLMSRISHSNDQSAQSPNLGLGESHSQGQDPLHTGLRRRHSAGQSTQSPRLGRSQSQSPSNPNLRLGGNPSQVQSPLLMRLRGMHNEGQSAQSSNLELGGSHSQGQSSFLIGLRERHNEGQSAQSPNLELGGSYSEGLFAQSTNPGLGGGNNQCQSPFLTGLRGIQRMSQSAQIPSLGLGESHSQGQSASSPNLGLINTAAEGFTRNIMSDALPESLALSQNRFFETLGLAPATPQAKRSLDRSPSESGSSGSPNVVKRHRSIPSSVPEDRPAADVQRRRSHEFRRNEPEVRREPRKRSYSSGLDKTETKEKQQKKD